MSGADTNIIITGAGGLLGRSLTDTLRKSAQVTACVSPWDSLSESASSASEILRLDLANLKPDELSKGFSSVYFLAQSRRYREFPAGAEDMLRVNVEAPVKFLKWGAERGAKSFIFASSGGVYGTPTQPVSEFVDINANDRRNFYLDTKLSAEILIRNFAPMYETLIIARPFFIYGPGQEKNMLIPRLVRNVLTGTPISLNGKDGIRINPIFVEDAAIAFRNFLHLKGSHTINVAGNEVLSLREIAETIGDISGSKPVFEYKDPGNDLVGDISYLNENVHRPSISFREGISSVIKEISNTL